MNQTTKKSIDLAAPTVAAGIVLFVLFSRKASGTVMAVATAIVWVLVYILTTRVTKTLVENGPAAVPTGGGCDDYDPKPLVDAVYADLDCTLCLRNTDLYKNILALSDCQLRKCYNYWNQQYYTTYGQKSLPVAIQEEWGTINPDFAIQQEAIAAKFATLNLQ